MIESLKSWIINICTAVFFITAIEMILPDNSIKKYGKFVLGLILISVILNPIIKIFNKGFNIDDYADNMERYLNQKQHEDDIQKYKKKNLQSTLEIFKQNLKSACEKDLKEKFPEDNYDVSAIAAYDDKKDQFKVDGFKVGVVEGGVKRIKKVEIGKDSSTQDEGKVDSETSYKIKNYLSGEFKIPERNILVYWGG